MWYERRVKLNNESMRELVAFAAQFGSWHRGKEIFLSDWEDRIDEIVQAFLGETEELSNGNIYPHTGDKYPTPRYRLQLEG